MDHFGKPILFVQDAITSIGVFTSVDGIVEVCPAAGMTDFCSRSDVHQNFGNYLFESNLTFLAQKKQPFAIMVGLTIESTDNNTFCFPS